MLKSLYIEAARKKGFFILEENILDDESPLSNFWTDKEIDEFKSDFKIAAGDGSFNKKKFVGYTFYAISSESLIYDGKLKNLENSEINTIVNNPYVEEFINTYMTIFELKSAFKTLEENEIDYYLIDGSLFGDLTSSSSFGIGLTNKIKEEIIDTCLDDLILGVNNLDINILSKDLINKYFKIYKNKFEIQLFLLNIEKLLVISKLFKHKEKIISISKSSITNELFRGNTPDIFIFDKYTVKEGYSKLFYKKIAKEIKVNFPIKDKYLKSQKFTSFYLRLADRKNLLKIELPYIASINKIEEIISKLKKYSVEGYPYLLKKAHKDVVITNRDMEKIVNIVDIREKSGREMLK